MPVVDLSSGRTASQCRSGAVAALQYTPAESLTHRLAIGPEQRDMMEILGPCTRCPLIQLPRRLDQPLDIKLLGPLVKALEEFQPTRLPLPSGPFLVVVEQLQPDAEDVCVERIERDVVRDLAAHEDDAVRAGEVRVVR